MPSRLLPSVMFLLIACLLTSTSAVGQSAPPPNPFAAFESFRLGNGMKVWYGYLPGATVTSMAVIVPAGFDDDPAGSGHTAHLLEHVLLSDRAGTGEAELVRALTARGGTYGGATFADRTYYWLNVTSVEADYGVRWLYHVIEPRALTGDLVSRNREPVAIEIDARPLNIIERSAQLYLRHPRLRPAPFWTREFGLHEPRAAALDPYRALQQIDAPALQRFFDTHYAPTTMTLVIVTGAPRGTLQPTLLETFGTLPWRPTLVSARPAELRTSQSRRFTWQWSRNTSLRLGYRIPELTAQDHLRLTLISGLLERRLMQRLRRGADKAVYSAGVTLVTRGPATMLLVSADLNPARETHVRAVIDAEIARIVNAASDTAFHDDRNALARELYTRYASPDALRSLAADRLYRPDLHAEFPDLGSYVAAAGPDSIAALAGRVFHDDARILRLARPVPLSPVWLTLIALMVILLGTRTYRALALRTVDMTTIRYVARLRHPLRILHYALLLGAALLGARLVAVAAHFAAEHWLFPVDSLSLTLLGAALLLFLLTIAALAMLGSVPRKVLVFDHELWIKSATYRARRIAAADIRAFALAGEAADADETGNRRFGRTAVLVRLADGTTRRFHVRRPDALLAALAALVRRTHADATASAVTSATPAL